MSAMGDLLRSFATRADSGENVAAAVVAAFGPQPEPVPEGFVHLPKTGHILPVPYPDEYPFWSYLYRSYSKAGGLPGQQSFMRVSAFAEDQPGKELRENWPAMVDKFYNNAAYATLYIWSSAWTADETYAAWTAAGKPAVDSLGNVCDVRGRPRQPGDPKF